MVTREQPRSLGHYGYERCGLAFALVKTLNGRTAVASDPGLSPSVASLTFLDKLIFVMFALVSMGVWAGSCITHVSAWGRSGRARRS